MRSFPYPPYKNVTISNVKEIWFWNSYLPTFLHNVMKYPFFLDGVPKEPDNTTLQKHDEIKENINIFPIPIMHNILNCLCSNFRWNFKLIILETLWKFCQKYNILTCRASFRWSSLKGVSWYKQGRGSVKPVSAVQTSVAYE